MNSTEFKELKKGDVVLNLTTGTAATVSSVNQKRGEVVLTNKITINQRSDYLKVSDGQTVD